MYKENTVKNTLKKIMNFINTKYLINNTRYNKGEADHH